MDLRVAAPALMRWGFLGFPTQCRTYLRPSTNGLCNSPRVGKRSKLDLTFYRRRRIMDGDDGKIPGDRITNPLPKRPEQKRHKFIDVVLVEIPFCLLDADLKITLNFLTFDGLHNFIIRPIHRAPRHP